MTASHRPPKDGVRAMPPGSISGDGKTLFGRISPFGTWAEIRSVREGHFLERHMPGSTTKTFRENAPKILFQHGKDPQLGHRVIADPIEFGEDATGPFYRAEILDGLDPLIVEGLKRGLYGSSHTFEVVKDDVVYPKAPSAHNPDMIPERTIREIRVPELGPVTWPAYLGTETYARSLTDEFLLADFAANPARLAELVDHIEPAALPVGAEATPHSEPVSRTEAEVPVTPPLVAPERDTSVSTEYVTRDEKSARVTELEAAISRRAVEFPGVFPPEVQAVDDAEFAERTALVADIAAWDSRQQRLQDFAGNPKATAPAAYSAPNIVKKPEDIYDLGAIRTASRSIDEVEQRTRDNALRSIEAAAARGLGVDKVAHIVENADHGPEGNGEIANRVLLTGSPTYKRAYEKYLRGEKDLWSPEEQRAAALAVVGTTTTGGYAVPYVFDPTIIRIGAYTAQNPYREACRVETITNGNNWRGVTVGAVTSAYVAEPTAATEQGPTFAQPTYTVQRAHAFATVSFETLQDRPDIASELSQVFAESKATYEENQFTLGVGTTVFPQGMFRTTAYTATNTATNDVTAISDTQLVEAALPLRFRAHGAWFMNRSTIRQLQVLDTTRLYFSGAGLTYAGQSNPNSPGANSTGNTGLTLLGYPVWEVPSAVSTLTTDAAIIAVFCDPKTYIIVDRIGMNVEVIPNMLNGATPSFPTGERGIYMYWRNTAKPLLADGGRQLTVF